MIRVDNILIRTEDISHVEEETATDVTCVVIYFKQGHNLKYIRTINITLNELQQLVNDEERSKSVATTL